MLSKLPSGNQAKDVSWRVLILLSCLFFLWMSFTATADVYNFYLSKQPGAKSPQPVEQPEEEEAAPKIEPPKPAPPLETVKSSEEAGKASSPIVINNINTNNNNVGTLQPTAAPLLFAPSPAVVAAPTLPPPTVPSTSMAVVTQGPDTPSHWKLGVVGSYFLPSSHNYTVYDRGGETAVGGGASLSYGVSKAVNVSLFGNLNTGAKLTAGLDLELMPFRIPVSDSLDIFQLGIIVGGSTAAAVDDNWGSLHIGARANINFSSRFGITAASRINFGYLMFEGGIVTRL